MYWAEKSKYCFPKLLRSPLYIIASPLALLIFLTMRLIKNFFILRIDKFISHRLGHFTCNVEIYLLEKELGINVPSGPYFDVWYHSIPICNKQLASMWSRLLYIGPRIIFKMVDKLNSMIPGGMIHKIRAKEESILPINPSPEQNFIDLRKNHNYSPYLDNTPPHLNFLPKEEQRGEAGLRAMGIPKGAQFVVLIVRDSAYLDHQSKSQNLVVDWSYHDYRDCDVQNYILAAEELVARGYYVIRMGALVKEAMNVDHAMIIDYATNGMRSDFMDIYLGAKCKFCISNGTGYEGIPYIFRKPIVFYRPCTFGVHQYLQCECLGYHQETLVA